MIAIKVFVKSTNEHRWTEYYNSEEVAKQELKHMQENHFNPEYFRFEYIENYSK